MVSSSAIQYMVTCVHCNLRIKQCNASCAVMNFMVCPVVMQCNAIHKASLQVPADLTTISL